MMSIDKFSEMWKPIKIGSVEIKNRFAMAPMGNGYVDHGSITQQYISYFAARARGGVGLIITPPGVGFTGGSKHYVQGLASLNSEEDKYGWNELAETVHAFDSKIFVQAMAGSAGRQVPARTPTKGPSAVPLRINPKNLPAKEEEFRIRRGLWPTNWDRFYQATAPEVLTIAEIEEIEDVWANQTLIAKESGVDGVELHFGHGYLAHCFLSPLWNLRSDAYGGNFENRLRFCINILTKARVLVGSNFTIGARLVGTDRMAGGLGVEDTIKIINRFEDHGLDYIDLTEGCYEQAKYFFPDDDGTMIPAAAALKKEVKVPIICPNIHNPQLGEQALKDGSIDMIGLGRPLLVEPGYVNKCAESGVNVKLKKCIRCLMCDRRIRANIGIRCEVNREVGNEKYDPKNWRINAPKKKRFWYPAEY